MSKQLIIFLHGYESSNQGFKANLIRNTFKNTLIPNFEGELSGRMKKLDKILKDKSKLIIIGSSFGGLMGSLYAFNHPTDVERLILFAPALSSPFLDQDLNFDPIDIPVIIIHGKHDTVVPLDPVKTFCKKYFKNLSYNVVDDDHRLHKTSESLDWVKLVSKGKIVLKNNKKKIN
ncbi:MAG: hypothetical protein GF364_21950 [Candidatus Lokiarchaeota archaeon]|nr:hypothetical protein [Candidatus Lokiarchaeota archaeon]